MPVIGIDAHKRTHTLVVVDDLGRKLGERTVAATSDGHLTAVQWAAQWPNVRFAVEDCRHMTRRLEHDLSRPGGDSQPCEGRSHASTEEVPGRGP
jgi:transposase